MLLPQAKTDPWKVRQVVWWWPHTTETTLTPLSDRTGLGFQLQMSEEDGAVDEEQCGWWPRRSASDPITAALVPHCPYSLLPQATIPPSITQHECSKPHETQVEG